MGHLFEVAFEHAYSEAPGKVELACVETPSITVSPGVDPQTGAALPAVTSQVPNPPGTISISAGIWQFTPTTGSTLVPGTYAWVYRIG